MFLFCYHLRLIKYQAIVRKIKLRNNVVPDLKRVYRGQRYADRFFCQDEVIWNIVLTGHNDHVSKGAFSVFIQVIVLLYSGMHILTRLANWNTDGNIFECSLFQNIVEDMILFQNASDAEIIAFYREIKKVMGRRDYHIAYLLSEDIRSNIDVIKKERSDDQGRETWFPLMLGYFNESPYAKKNGLSGDADMLKHFSHRQELELTICKEVFPGKYTLLKSKGYKDEDIL